MIADLAVDLPGRATQLQAIDERLSYVQSFQKLNGRIRVDVGPRGVGKTSLLRAYERAAQDRGFVTVFITAGDRPFLETVSAEFTALSHRWQDSARAQIHAAVAHLTIGIGPVSIKTATGPAAAAVPRRGAGRELQTLIRAATEQARRNDAVGLAVFVDEIQSADPDGLRALGYAWQNMQADDADLPATLFAAGLSHSQDVITSAVSFAERFEYDHLRNLNDGAAITALVGPAGRRGVAWSPDAAAAALTFAQNYPYFVQLIGNETWKAAGFPAPGDTLTAGHVEAAAAAFTTTQNSFFRARWAKATEAETQMLAAMAGLGDTDVRRRDIAAALGTRTESISDARRSLMDKGLIEEAGYGRLSFTAPGFAAYIREEILGVDRDELPAAEPAPAGDRQRITELLAATQAPTPPASRAERPPRVVPPVIYRDRGRGLDGGGLER